MKLTNCLWMAAASLALFAADVGAEVKLPPVIADSMVLQQQATTPIWGWAEPGEKVTVQVGDEQHEATADAEGRWRVNLEPREASKQPIEITVRGADNEITVKDVLVGEVWICSGQSNMEWRLAQSMNAKEEIAAADYPNIRLFNVPGHISSPTPKQQTPGKWGACTPQSATHFSAVGYFFGRKLHEELDVPIGLIGTNWGGTKIEPWTPPVGFYSVPELKDYADNVRPWDEAIQSGKTVDATKLPKLIRGATTIYNGMVHGLVPYRVRGAIWYQGESNAGDGLKYEYMKRALVNGWREVFGNDQLAFYWVQLANYQKPSDNPAGGGWGPVREGQRRALSLPHTGMAVTIDIGEAGDIHPRNKQDVGRRLALSALAGEYGKKIVGSGPMYREHKVEGDKIRVAFDHIGGGLMVGKKEGLEPTKQVADGKLNRFAISGGDGKWYWADAVIDGQTVLVSAPEVSKPVAVRYGYESNPVGANLYNKEGLPASPFTTVD